MNRNEWAFKLRQACSPAVRLPKKGLDISGSTHDCRIDLDASAVSANMQEDDAAFEGWALALLAWGGVTRMRLGWQAPGDTAHPHYQRFLYRVSKFCEFFPEVSVRQPELLDHLRLRPGCGDFVLNVAGTSSAQGSGQSGEGALERALLDASTPAHAWLMNRLKLVTLDRQFPVGVFTDSVGRANAVFTGGKSAIDLIGIDASGVLWVIELKVGKNRKVGAISELFFYTMVLHDLRAGRLQAPDSPGPRAVVTATNVRAATNLRGLLLMGPGQPGCPVHPLLADRVLPLLSRRVGNIDYTWDVVLVP